jgi:hypothetical protein
VRRAAIATLAVTVAGIAHAHADTAAKEPEPDEIADIEAREANLESKEPRKGLTVAAAIGGGILLGGDIGVGRGPALSLRLGHVATRKTVITFELVGNSGLHKESTTGNTLTDSNFALFAGAQRYTSKSLWVRAAGGYTVFVEDAMTDGTGGRDPINGIGGLIGGGVDLARWGYLVLGLETFGMASLSRDGLKVQLAFSLGLSYY